MVFHVFRNSEQGAYFVLLILCTLSCVVALVLRFVATRRSDRRAGAEDWLALVAVLVFLAQIGFALAGKASRLEPPSRSLRPLASLHIFPGLVIINGYQIDLNIEMYKVEEVSKVSRQSHGIIAPV